MVETDLTQESIKKQIEDSYFLNKIKTSCFKTDQL